MTDRSELREALADAKDLPDGEGKVTELERLTAHADAAQDVRLGFDVRMELIDAYNNHTERWRMLPAFGWCLATFDREPELFDDWDAELLRWYHKWAVATLRGTPRVGLAQTNAALDDMERRFREGGHSLHTVYNLRCRIADHLGDEAEARKWLAQWRAARRDENSDCAGCDPSRQADLLAGWGAWEEAIHVVEPVLTGVLGCTEQPEKAMVTALTPYLRLGRYDEAAKAHVRAYRRHRHERDSFSYLAEHLRFCALTANYDRGLDILAEHLGWLDRPYDEMSAMEFSAAGALVCRLAAEAGSTRTITRPEYGDRPAEELTLPALGATLVAVAEDLAGQFDARNGTTHQSGRMAAWLAERPLDEPIPLPVDEPTAGGWSGELDDQPADWLDVVAPLRLESLVAVLHERGDHYVVHEDGTVGGRWGSAIVQFELLGEHGEVLHARIITERQLPADRLADAYEFCNAWNHDRLLPKAYVHDEGDGNLLLAGDVSTDLEHGVTGQQLAILVNATVSAGATFADAAAELP